MGVAYRWQGERDANGRAFEFFGAPDPIPSRDLTDDDIATLSPAQRSKLESPAGRRLFRKVEPPKPPAPKKVKDAGDRAKE